jgi:hypothetical protein
MTTKTPVTVKPVPDAREVPEVLEAIREGLTSALMRLDGPQWNPAYNALTEEESEPEAVAAYTPVYESTVEEIVPEVARLLTEALNRRLPWTWEPPVSGQ